MKNVPAFIDEVKSGKGGRLMGFGHRVYKSYDPRAKIVKKLADEVFEVVGMDKDLEIALELERIALSDDYFVSRKLYPNVDFYTGLIYRAMKFPTDFFTVLFAVARTAGWLAQWEEMLLDKEQKIARPRQIYTGLRRAAVQVLPRSSQEARKACVSTVAPLEWTDFIVHGFDYCRFPLGSRVLDVGCGAGEQLASLRRAGIEAVGVEPSRELVESLVAAGFDARRGFAEQLPVEDRSFDGLICKVVLPYTDERRAIAEWSRVLRPNATVRASYHGAGYYLRYLFDGTGVAERIVRAAIARQQLVVRGHEFAPARLHWRHPVPVDAPARRVLPGARIFARARLAVAKLSRQAGVHLSRASAAGDLIRGFRRWTPRATGWPHRPRFIGCCGSNGSIGSLRESTSLRPQRAVSL